MLIAKSRRSLVLLFIVACTGAGTAGCTALRPLVAPSAHQCPWIDVEPAQLSGPGRQQLRARVTATGVDHAFGVAVERTEDSLLLVGLTPLGTKSFEVERRGKRVRAANHLGLASVVPPRNVLADVSGILAASPCSPSVAGEAAAELGRWTITDTCSGGRPARRHVRGPGAVGNVDIEYRGNETIVTQHDCGYEAIYVAVASEDAAMVAPPSSQRDLTAPAASARTASEPAAPAPVAIAPGDTTPATIAPAATAPAATSPRPSDGAVAAAQSEPERRPPAAPPAEVDPASLTISPRIAAIIEDIDRSDDDLALDAGRRPAELLAFLEIEPGMRVAELGAGGGYTAELLARAVGPRGTVYAQNNRLILDRFAEKPWSERLARPVMRRVVRVDREFSDPLPAEARDLDVVVMNLFYHDTVWMKADRDAMNRAIYRALRPGGRYVVIDHSARRGRGIQDVESLHRIEESVVRDEVVRAGFRLRRQAGFLRNPSDPRDWNDSPRAAGDRRGTSDRFVLEFLKPGG
ncbi:MAG TPA: DUF3261 domain-containing protein [Candidatus Limnocylindrales bacterium]|nr:DUF3261 domain-containing protein [Candidatus Limnocylindrales bacterium]